MIIISACLAGVPCRYNGTDFPVPELNAFIENKNFLCVCPEMLGGLSAPRSPCEIKKHRGEISVIGKDGNDYTEEFQRGAEIVLEICRSNNAKTAVLKARSPSCGCGKIYDGTFSGKLIDGNGVCAELLLKNGISVYTEENWHSAFGRNALEEMPKLIRT
jgi:D-alanine-D-alanine ligase